MYYNIAKISLNIVAILFFNIAHIYGKNIVISGSGEFNDMILEDVVGSGSMDAENSEFKTFIVNGSLDFADIKVIEILTVIGSAKGKGLESKRLVVSGSCIGENIIVTGDAIVEGGLEVINSKMQAHTTIVGELKARRSKFHDLEVDSNEIILSDSTTHNITINESSEYDTQKIILKGKTIISGDIIFKSGRGQVVKDKDAVIKGKIEGGMLHKL
jgi:hypothetical protein